MDEDFARAYGDYADWHWWFRGRRRVIELFLDRCFRRDQKSRILAVGGGKFERDLLGPRGTYFSLNARRPRSNEVPEGEISTMGGLPDLPFRDGSFDLVCLFDVLEHIEDDRASLEELYRILSPGGRLVLTVPAFSFLWSEHDLVNEHYRRYTFGRLGEKIEGANFEILDWSYFNTLLFPVVFTVRMIQRLLPVSGSGETSYDFEKNRPGAFNNLLARLFAFEAVLLKTLTFPVGVSLLVVAHKKE